jgi:hypothetical protein
VSRLGMSKTIPTLLYTSLWDADYLINKLHGNFTFTSSCRVCVQFIHHIPVIKECPKYNSTDFIGKVLASSDHVNEKCLFFNNFLKPD